MTKENSKTLHEKIHLNLNKTLEHLGKKHEHNECGENTENNQRRQTEVSDY